jgi:hypothetical protein
MGNSTYVQTRIAVGDGHYLKGMAVYKDDLPDGVDLMFNTNKSSTGNKLDAFKKMEINKETGKVDEDNPFGSIVRQIGEKNPDGSQKTVTSALNIVNEEADWDRWSKTLSSQVLSKQSPALAKSQLAMTYEKRKQDLDDIMALTNPTVRKKLLTAYADKTDSASVHLKAAALPGQKTHVILPISSLKPTEIYAPNYDNGTRVALIRYPHGGTFEIPELVVNNRNREAIKTLGQGLENKAAVGIHHQVAVRLSGADFDGDTVLVIPNGRGTIKTTPALEGLKDFDARASYPRYEGMPKMSPEAKAMHMGDVSNLITDMTIQGAKTEEIARAVRHSMVVIDAEKHDLNYKQSAIDNGIKALKEKYQGGARKGASTLISRASSDVFVNKRKPRSVREGGPIDKATGKKVFTETGEGYVNAKGKFVPRTDKSKRLAETDDAYTLLSQNGGTSIERVYADHSNRLKALANEARKAAVFTKSTPYSQSAKTAYATEVASLDAALNRAIKNRPLERQAQVVANSVLATKRAAKPDMSSSEIKKVKAQALTEARIRTGAAKNRIIISPSEWAAIQAGAISTNKLTQILDNADLDTVKKLATPKTRILMTPTKTQRATSMLASGYTQAEVAAALGVSVTTLKDSVA